MAGGCCNLNRNRMNTKSLRLNMTKNTLLLAILLCTLAFACRHNEGGKTRDNEFKLISENVTKVIPELHSISELKTLFDEAGIDFYPELVNDPAKATMYMGKQKTAANLGAYMADLVYVMSTGEEEKPDYKAVLNLADEFGFSNEVLRLSYQRFEEENTSVEDFYGGLQQALENSSKQMSESEASEIHSYLIYGNYIEKLYLVSSLMERDYKNIDEKTEAMLKRNFLTLLTNQVSRINEMIYILGKYPDQWSEVVDLKELQKLMDVYLLANTKRDSLLTLSPSEIYKAQEVKAVVDQIDILRRRIVLY